MAAYYPYFFIYCTMHIITPHSIQWQMDLSFSRTLTNAAPPLLWFCMVALWKYTQV